jgi:hypothetical protein
VSAERLIARGAVCQFHVDNMSAAVGSTHKGCSVGALVGELVCDCTSALQPSPPRYSPCVWSLQLLACVSDHMGCSITVHSTPWSELLCTLCLPFRLCRSLALLPLSPTTTSSSSSSRGWSDAGISSSVLTSLAVGVPLVVPAAFLEAYPMLKEEHVVLLVRTWVFLGWVCGVCAGLCVCVGGGGWLCLLASWRPTPCSRMSM